MQSLWNKPFLQNRVRLFSSYLAHHLSDGHNGKNAIKTSLTQAFQT